jgi:hypothetical protein
VTAVPCLIDLDVTSVHNEVMLQPGLFVEIRICDWDEYCGMSTESQDWEASGRSSAKTLVAKQQSRNRLFFVRNTQFICNL